MKTLAEGPCLHIPRYLKTNIVLVSDRNESFQQNLKLVADLSFLAPPCRVSCSCAADF